jgi:hypothetical protein
MLDKAEAEIGIQKCKVRTLEGIIVELGGVVPKDEEISKRAKEEQRLKEAAEEEKASLLEVESQPDLIDEEQPQEEIVTHP